MAIGLGALFILVLALMVFFWLTRVAERKQHQQMLAAFGWSPIGLAQTRVGMLRAVMFGGFVRGGVGVWRGLYAEIYPSCVSRPPLGRGDVKGKSLRLPWSPGIGRLGSNHGETRRVALTSYTPTWGRARPIRPGRAVGLGVVADGESEALFGACRK